MPTPEFITHGSSWTRPIQASGSTAQFRQPFHHAIFADLSVSETGGNITMIDVFTGVQVSPPPCSELAEATAYYMLDIIDLLCCTLTGPISSPKARLLVSTSDIVGWLLVWRIGSDDWQDAITDHANLGPIDQIVVFKNKIIALDIDLSLYIVHLDDDAELGMSIRPMLIVEENDDNMVNNEALLNLRLVVVCGDKLAMVGTPSPDWETLVFFHLDGLDSPTEPPRWSPVPELDGAVFINGAHGGHTIFEGLYGRWVLSSAHPERWGGRKGHVAIAGHTNEVYPFPSGRLLPSWVSPSVLSLDGDTGYWNVMQVTEIGTGKELEMQILGALNM
ncbi:hypothetical protein C2845_PM09G00750 [Panicum miliaceum]|uniref:KIB1-4 beta-propeller domain-containing protein n=1 Tax=Panicum miliaceum TaxID=4540 RepID=A0A3L6S4L3_PANMI|nr:hypothetical protein C2845_PM09G00750 [Panicum miliaceum]